MTDKVTVDNAVEKLQSLKSAIEADIAKDQKLLNEHLRKRSIFAARYEKQIASSRVVLKSFEKAIKELKPDITPGPPDDKGKPNG